MKVFPAGFDPKVWETKFCAPKKNFQVLGLYNFFSLSSFERWGYLTRRKKNQCAVSKSCQFFSVLQIRRKTQCSELAVVLLKRTTTVQFCVRWILLKMARWNPILAVYLFRDIRSCMWRRSSSSAHRVWKYHLCVRCQRIEPGMLSPRPFWKTAFL